MPIDMLGLGIGIDDECIGMGIELWPLAAVERPDEQAAASSASAAAATTVLNVEPGNRPPGDADVDMDRPP
jgi:hypothetical protein